MFSKILVANRGEIAVRVIRTCREMGIKTAAIYSEADANSLHVQLADEAYPVGPAEASSSYLAIDKILDIARRSGAEAIHPGSGFLAENPEFVEMCERQGVTFIGPPSRCMSRVKPKDRARQLMKLLNIPIVPGSDEPLINSKSGRLAQVEDTAEAIGYPVILKPSGGGGGIGMVTARSRRELADAVSMVEERGQKAFGISSFYVEKLFSGIKHIEFQVLADRYGTTVHLGERDCSIQRRFQKLVEETPCHILSPRLRMKMAVAALDVAVALQYVNALTVEFFYLPDTQEFYFNEVNSRLQVEHCVTELATGLDIVKEQIRIAAGEPLGYTQDDVSRQASAIECRITAEDAARNFLPSPGTITGLRLPHGMGLRIDEGVHEGYAVPFYYDSLILKLMAWGKHRSEAISRMQRALTEIRIDGVKTCVGFHQATMENESFLAGDYTTDFLDRQNMIQRVRERERAAGR